MSFKDPAKIWDTIQAMIDAEAPRARNRARINSLFNGNPPYSDWEASQDRIETNVNFLEGVEIIQKARAQFENAFLKPQNFFKVRLDIGPPEKRREWGGTITRHINRAMKRYPGYFQTLENQFASVVLHGVGPVTWFRDRHWCPKAKGIDDVLVPSGTTVDLENLNYFAVYVTFTPAELQRATNGGSVDKGWNKQLVNDSLKWLLEQRGRTSSMTYQNTYDQPEKVVEDYKENSGYWASDAVPVLRCYDFYYLCDEDKPYWQRKVVLDQNSGQLAGVANKGDVLYDGGDKSYGYDNSQILHVQYADGCVVPPFRWHSVRSLGYLLYAVCHLQNRLRCKFTDAVFESLLWYFRNVSEGDKERLEKIDLHHLGIIPEGLSWVPANERHTINFELMNGALAMNRQLMAEHSAAYTQDIDSGTRKEMTATEAMARVQDANAMVGSMLTRAYVYQTYQYQEIGRRFATLSLPECKRFRELCMFEGVPEAIFKMTDAWMFEPERVMGQGNKMLEIAQSDRLMAVRPLLDPEAQREVVHMYVEANTDDALLAAQLVPLEPQAPSSGAQLASLAWGSLIDAKPVMLSEGINRIDYVETLLRDLQADIARINDAGGTPEAPRIQGLMNVIQHLQVNIQIIAQDQAQGERVKIYKDILGKAANEVKAYMQRLAEAQQAASQGDGQGGLDPETAAKIQSQIILAQSKAQIQQAAAEQRRQQRQLAFVSEEERKNMGAMSEQQRKTMQNRADIAEQDVRTQSDIIRENILSAHEARTANESETAVPPE